MNRLPTIIATLIISTIFFLSQTIASPHVELSSKQQKVDLKSYIDLFFETGTPLAVNELLSPEIQQQFTPFNGSTLRLSSPDETLWLRFSVHNPGSNHHVVLQLLPDTVSYYSLYRLDNNQPVLIGHGGVATPFHQRAITIPPLLENIYLDEHSQNDFLIRLQSDQPSDIHLLLHDGNALYHHLSYRSWLTGATLGIFIVLLIANLIFALLRRSPIYLLHTGYIFSLIGLLSSQWGFGYYLYGQNNDGYYNSFIFFAYVAFILTLEMTLFICRLPRRWGYNAHTLIRGLQTANITAFLSLLLFGHTATISLGYLLAIITSLSIILVCLTSYIQQQNRYALFFAITRLLNICAIIIYAFNNSLNSDAYFAGGLIIASIALTEICLINTTLLTQSFHRLRRDTAHEINRAVLYNQKQQHNMLLGDINTQIGTPLSDMMAMAGLLRKSTLNEQQDSLLAQLQNNVQALLNNLDEVIDDSRINNGEIYLNDDIFELNQLIEQCCEGYQQTAEQKRIELIANTQQAFALRCQGDRHRVRQILLILISNAINNTENGEVVVSCKTAFVDDDNANIAITIKDNGRGLSYNQQRRLFQHTSPSQYDAPLATIHRLAELMGGKLSVQSQIGSGCIFHLSLQLPAKAYEIDTSEATNSLYGIKALLVDDNENSRAIMTDLLRSWNVQSDWASNASEALAKLRNKANIQDHYNLILIDYDLPSLNGLQLAERIKDDPQLNQLDHISLLLTSPLITIEVSRYREAGISRRIEKPFDPLQLKLLLAELIRKQNAIRADIQRATLQQNHFDSEKINVLVAEDNIVSAKVMLGMLKKLQVNCQIVSNGQEAVDSITNGHYHLIFMDCEMPVMDGIAATRRIRQWEHKNALPEIPIIALTAHVQSHYKQDSLDAGMNDHLAKPVDIHQLQLTLKHWAPLLVND
ncbi:signal transduction histidine kinase [Sinobacterium caligoides]|uniref:Signal transduction histidine kinase n=1 Tax=Sinobacterium caligoides TaxID=933926 RepID=A0A3N2DP03_9GAMM|nr:response regulator [Sinobacterium caligoides]ROS01533.1 signal transduction histidine kinase [Sinobacterium caligoides]